MRIDSIRLRPYRLPMRRPWRGASATVDMRLGALVGVGAQGLVGWGDCAPLPSMGEAGRASAFAALEAGARTLAHTLADDAMALLADVAQPQARWALETALRDLRAQHGGLSLRRALRGDASDAVKVNAALGALDDGCGARALAAVAQGFDVAKIKVGVFEPADEIQRLSALSQRVGHWLRLRLDANRAWRDDEAARFFAAVADLPIDGVEEPLAAPSLSGLAALQRNAPFAVAIDESLFDLGPEAIFAKGGVKRLVVKPARIGGLDATLRLADKARAAGMEVVVTSVVDSAIGVAAAAQLAAALDGAIAHGLATGAWLREDVAAPLPISHGQIVLPDAPGLGLRPKAQFA